MLDDGNHDHNSQQAATAVLDRCRSRRNGTHFWDPTEEDAAMPTSIQIGLSPSGNPTAMALMDDYYAAERHLPYVVEID